MKLRFYIGLLIMIETFIFGCTWLMGYDLTFKEKMKNCNSNECDCWRIIFWFVFGIVTTQCV